jgi:undecaprenyl diphosphate synthase
LNHIAMIMDGNRRWARKNGLRSISEGHKRAIDVASNVVTFCLNKGIKYLSLYTFSIENFRREEFEKEFLFNLLVEYLKNNTDDFIKNGIKVRMVGDKNLFPEHTREIISNVEKLTAHLDKLQLNMLFCYGARQEIVNAAKRMAEKVKNGDLAPSDINEDNFRSEMWLGNIPDPELIIRTSGVSRLSNFLVFQGAYSEWMFVDEFWPEVDEKILQRCIDKFHTIKRNFGH